MSEVVPIIEPDPEQMLRHLEHLFDGFLNGCQDGRIELAWTDAKDGSLRHAAIFGTDELDVMVERAVVENLKQNQNVYVGVALRKPDIPPFGRCRDDDFYALTAFYADLDDEGAAEQAKALYQNAPPTAVVVTGRKPHVRAQLLWRQETPERDPSICRRQNLAIAEALGGDRTVVNPSRVLRLGGSIAWPIKEGRVVERTEFITFDDDRTKTYLPGQVATTFTLKATPPSASSPSPPASSAPPLPTAPLNIGSEFDGIKVEDCLARVRAGDHWHDNMVRLTGHWIARNWSNAEIITAASSLTLPGWTVEQTVREVTAMIASGRAKWNVPNPAHEVEDATAVAPLSPSFIEELNIAMLPCRRWILGNAAMRRSVTVTVAPPGVGKSTLSIEQAVAIATGREITGQTVHEHPKVWIYNNEDDADELKRRLGAILQHWDIPLAEIKGRLALDSGADRPLLVAKTDQAGNVIRLPDVDACIEQIRRHDIGVFIVDPFVETHGVDENSNQDINAVGGMFREIAREGDCAVILVHHTSKPPQGSSDGHAGNMNTARGASALLGVARVIQTLFSMSAKDAEKLGIPENERHRYIRLDDAKINYGLISGDAKWFRRTGVTIANGEEVGVLAPADLKVEAGSELTQGSEDLHKSIIAVLLARTSDPELTLNAAAKLLAWSGDERFARYRQTDAKGNQRVKRSLRDAVIAACRSATVIVSSDKTHGFTCNETASPIVINRFERAFSNVELAAQKPDFTEEDLG